MTNRAGLDVLLINPGGRRAIYQDLADTLAAVEPPVWAGLMATYVRRKGFSVEVLDANALELTPEEVAKHTAERAPKLVAVVAYGHQPSASTQAMPAAGATCTVIKELSSEMPVLLVGGHAAALPERTLAEEDADFVCSAEGPTTVVDLLEALEASPPTLPTVRGLYFYEDDRIVHGPPAPLVHDVDEEMPGLAWDLLPMDRYRAHNWHCFGHLEREPYAALYTSLGCPYRCSFCCIQAPFKEGERLAGHREQANTYRMWSVETTMKEIDTLVNDYGVRNIKIADELFVLNRKHVDELCDAIIAQGYDLNIWAYARVDTIKEGMAEKLRAAGVRWLALGIEAANANVRDGVEKGYDQAMIVKAVDELKAAGIYTIGNYIFGLPDDTHESMQETLDLALELNCEFANFYCAMAYPGSALYTQAQSEGWALPGSWAGYSQHSYDSLPLPTKHLSAAEVLRFRDKAFDEYFASPRYQAAVRKTFGQDTLDHITQMASHVLERKYA